MLFYKLEIFTFALKSLLSETPKKCNKRITIKISQQSISLSLFDKFIEAQYVPYEILAMAAEGWLFEKARNKFMILYFVDILLAESSSSLYTGWRCRLPFVRRPVVVISTIVVIVSVSHHVAFQTIRIQTLVTNL